MKSDVEVEVEVLIRPAKVADVPAMAGLLAELFAVETEFTVDRAKQERALRMVIERPSAAAWVAEAPDKQVVGMVTAQTVVSTAEGGESAWVEDVIVRQDWRRRGVGRKLIEGVESWCRGRGITRMQLLADSSNEEAMAFYARRSPWQRTRMVAFRKLLDQ
jgi:ribosomal protein S18 acetylase RimI-like enzyme